MEIAIVQFIALLWRINVYLAMTGQEEVQHKVFTAMGVADADVRGWFNGPAFLTWSRGQNEYGAGIAGPQIGEGWRIFVVEGSGANPRYPYKPKLPLTVFVNPELEVVDEAPMEIFEGCLSIPGVRGRVARASKVRCAARRLLARALGRARLQ